MAIIQTHAFVIKTIPFQDTSLIVRLFTESQGKIAVIAKGARSLKSPFRGMLEPVSLLDVQFYYKPTRDIQTLAKIEILENYLFGCEEIQPAVIAMAILECLDKFIRDHHEDRSVFALTVEALRTIDACRTAGAEVFLYFLIKMTDLMGYRIDFNNKTALSITPAGIDFLREIDEADIRNGLPHFPANLPIGGIAKTLVDYLAAQMDLPVHLKSLELFRQFSVDSTGKV
jgi:DNA repair protein RecO (recombination protein O)